MPERLENRNRFANLESNLVSALEKADIDPQKSVMHLRESVQEISLALGVRGSTDVNQLLSDESIDWLLKTVEFPDPIREAILLIQRLDLCKTNIDIVDAHEWLYASLSALMTLSIWFYREHLGINFPSDVAEANNQFDRSIDDAVDTFYSPEDRRILEKELNLPYPLRPYQWEGISFLHNNEAALLADEMGLGKTVQTIVAIRLIMQDTVTKRVLIIAPNALAFNWEREFELWAPDLIVRRVIGNTKDRLATYQLPIQVLIATYEQFRVDSIDMHPHLHFEVVVIDEAQRIKNRHSLSSLSCRLIPRSRSWALTGTPLENSIEDIISLFIFLKSGLVDSGIPPNEILRRIKPHFLRRRKKDVLGEMPPIITQDISLELTGSQQTAYVDSWVSRYERIDKDDYSVSRGALFSLLTKLKQLCNYEPESGESVKLDMLKILLEECSTSDDKIIVFSQYVETLNFISDRIAFIPHDMYTGDQTQEEKDKVLLKFKENPGPRALLMSLRSGGVGLNIQEASTVVLFDRWWNPAVEDQAVHRAHRFGRARPLHVIRFLVSDTVEEHIQKILTEKRLDFERYIENAETASVRMFTNEELRKILKLTISDTDLE